MRMKFFAAALITLASGCGTSPNALPTFHGGDQVGNGGKAVVCRDDSGKISSAEILDFYEGRLQYGWLPKFLNEAIELSIPVALKPLQAMDEKRYQRYLRYVETFAANARMIASPLFFTNDSDNILEPPRGCAIEQLVLQKEPTFSLDRRYNINQEVWDSLDNQNRIGIVLHEITYYEAIRQGHFNSIAARFLTGMIASGFISEISQPEYEQLIEDARLGIHIEQSDSVAHTLVESPKATWQVARTACEFFAAGTLPEASGLKLISGKPDLRNLVEFMRPNQLPVVWTNELGNADGTAVVGVLDLDSDQIGWMERNQNSSAEIICTKEIDHE